MDRKLSTEIYALESALSKYEERRVDLSVLKTYGNLYIINDEDDRRIRINYEQLKEVIDKDIENCQSMIDKIELKIKEL